MVQNIGQITAYIPQPNTISTSIPSHPQDTNSVKLISVNQLKDNTSKHKFVAEFNNWLADLHLSPDGVKED